MTTSLRSSLATVLLCCAMIGCAPGDAEDQAVQADSVHVPDVVLQVAAAANAIAAQPEATDSILAANALTRAEFDSLLYEIAAEPAWTDAYEAARR